MKKGLSPNKILTSLGDYMRKRKTLLLSLSAMVVFVTTYMLILPALTLEEDEAARQGGIDVPASEQIVDSETGDSDTKAGPAFAGDGYTISLEAGTSAKLPEDTELTAAEVTPDDKDYEAWCDEALKALQESSAVKEDISGLKSARFYDITLLADGSVVEPKDAVGVTISYDKSIKMENKDDVKVIHFGVDKKGNLKPEVLKDSAVSVKASKGKKKGTIEVSDVAFDATGFSMYGVVETSVYERTIMTADGKTYKVTVTAGADAQIPQDAELEVSELTESDADYQAYADETADAIGTEAEALNYAKFLDISIVDNGQKIQPLVPVDVQIQMLDRTSEGDVQVVHFGEKREVLEASTEGDTVSFHTEGFSIYAIVDDDQDNARIGYRFWYNDGSQNVLLSTQYFRYKDIHPSGSESNPLSINEPSIPEIDHATWVRIFKGWSKTGFEDSDENLVTVDDLNQELNEKARNQYVEGTYVDLYANLKNVYYVTYVDVNPNNVLSTDIIPKAETGDTTFNVKPKEQLRPTIDSDTELEGWYDINKPDTVYTPGQQNVVIDSNITLYPKVEGGAWLIFDDNDLVNDGSGSMVSGGASFTPPAFYYNETTQRPPDPTWAGYEFGGWYTDPECNTPFEFGGTISHDTTVYAKWIPGESSYRVVIWKQRTSDEPNTPDAQKIYDYVTSYLYDENVVTGQTVNLDNSYKNIYGNNGTSTDPDKGYFTYNQNLTNQSIVVNADGTSVLNVYYDRKPVTLNYYIYDYIYTVSQGDNDNNPEKYGDINGQKARVYWRNGAFRTTDRNNGTVYNGTIYTRNNSRSWHIYKSFTGLYGSTLEENGYSWPEEYDWYANGHGTGGNADASWWSGYSEGDTSGTRTTFMSAFLPTDVSTSSNTITVNFYGSNPSGSYTIHFLVQNLDGSYEEKDTVKAASRSFLISDKYIGFHAHQYRADNGQWTSVGNKNSQGYYNNGNPVSYTSNLYIRFNRTNYTLTFYTNNGSNQLVDHTVPYDQPLETYAGQNEGQYKGHYFLGWYADPSCTEPFDFNQSMPDNNVAVYGKWKMRRVRVVIEPGADNVYMGSQSTRFRVDYDERIDGGLLETATRAGYILDGWYTDPEFTNRFLFSSPVNDDTTDVAWDYHTASHWAAERAAYGDDTEANENVRGILHLYAKWIPDLNSRGINVVYDPGDAALYDSLGTLLTTVPIDPHMYDFYSQSVAREAPSNYSDLYTFMGWEATLEDGTIITYSPGEPVDLSDLRATDTMVDEITGEVLRKTVTLRAVYKQTGDQNRQTTITYDGNTFTEELYNGGTQEVQGKTADGTERKTIKLNKEVNQNIELPSADDFYLDGYELVGWSFTKGTYEQQVAEATDEAPNFQPGQQVAADNLIISDLNDERNTLYAMWQPKKYSITVRQVVESGVPQNTFEYKYKTGAERTLPSGSTPKSLTGNTSFTLDDFGYYELMGDVIHIEPPVIPPEASYDVRVNAVVTKDDGTTEILPLTSAGNYPVLGNIVITYTYSQKVLLKMQKRDATNHSEVLTGADFDITPVEFNTETNRWEDAGSGISITVNAATFERYLQEGTYRITETNAPANHALIGTDLYLTIDKENDWHLFTSSGDNVDEATAKLNNAGDTLIVYDNPVHTVTFGKTVENSGAGEFAFRITVMDSNNTGLRNYVIGTWGDQELRTNNVGELNISLKHRDVVQLMIPHGCKLKVDETETAVYKAQYTWSGDQSTDPVESSTFGPETITEDGNLVFANLLKVVPVTLKKVGVDNTVIEPAEVPLDGASFTIYTSATGTSQDDIAKDADGRTLKDLSSGADGVFFSGSLQVGKYYLEETTVPDGYYGPLGRFELNVSTTTDPTIKATWITGSESGSQGAVSGDLINGYMVTIRNVAGVELPSTGGLGTHWIYILGSILLLGCGVTLIGRRRIRNHS